ncbi:MAG: CHAD domain-containing protein [Saprospiraceae bacterium]|nr:CHAD domain-containing protein [Saprospiraceae bacterium]
MKEAIIQLTKEKIAEFHKYFYKVKEWKEMEDIHQLRLTIKNLRVILSILDLATNKGFNKRSHFKIFSPLFKSAGRLREVQINMKLMHKLEDKNSRKYLKHLKKKESQQLKDLKRIIKRFDLKRLKKLNRKLISNTGKLKAKKLRKTISKYLHGNLQRIKKTKQNIKGERDIHDIRIYLKRVEEVLVLLKSTGSMEGNARLLKEVRSSRNKIGKWHDYIIFSSSVKGYIDQSKIMKHKKPALKIHKRVKKIINERKKKLLVNLESLKINDLLVI